MLVGSNDSEVDYVLNWKYEHYQEFKVLLVFWLMFALTKNGIAPISGNLYSHEIIGCSAESNKTAALVPRAFTFVPYNLNRLDIISHRLW